MRVCVCVSGTSTAYVASQLATNPTLQFTHAHTHTIHISSHYHSYFIYLFRICEGIESLGEQNLRCWRWVLGYGVGHLGETNYIGHKTGQFSRILHLKSFEWVRLKIRHPRNPMVNHHGPYEDCRSGGAPYFQTHTHTQMRFNAFSIIFSCEFQYLVCHATSKTIFLPRLGWTLLTNWSFVLRFSESVWTGALLGHAQTIFRDCW